MSRLSWRLLAWGGVPALAVALLAVARPTSLARLESVVFDAMVRAAPVRPPGSRVVIVDIDDRSLTTIGQWPWRRDVMAALIDRLRDGGASSVVLDIIFSEPDRQPSGSVDTDVALAEALAGGRVVLGYAFTFDPAPGRPADCVRHALNVPVLRPRSNPDEEIPPLFRPTSALCNLPALSEAATASGFLNAAPDPDGILRRVPMLMEFGGRIFPSLSVAAVSMAIAARDTSLSVSNVNLSWLVLDDRRVPLDGQGNLLLRFRGPKRTFPYHSAADVLGGAAPADAFANRIVLVGTTALGTRDVVTTPLDTLFAGVEVHATAIDNLLQRDYLGRHEHGVAMAAQLALTLGAAATAAIAGLGFARAGFVIALALAALYGGTFWLLQRDGLFVSPLFPTASLLVSASAMAIVRYRTARANAEQADRDKATSQRLMVRTLLSLTEIRDADTGRHARRTEQYTRVLATELASDPAYAADLTPARIELMANLAPLHDIGKVGVPDRLLNKPGKLTEEERVEMQQHAQYGRDVIERAQRDAGAIDDEILTMAKEIVYTHHEKWDGSGYPRGLRGSEIPIVGRIMAVVDVYDAIMSRRAYQAASSHDVAVSRVVDGRGTHFDPDVVNAFERVAPRLAGLSGDGDR